MRSYRLTNGLARFSLLLPALLLSSCSLTFGVKNPLSDPDKAKPDARLFGAWRILEERQNNQHPKETHLLFLGKSGHRDAPSGTMKCVVAGIKADHNVYADEYLYFFTTSIGNSTYANLFEGVVFDRAKFPTWDKRNIKLYLLAKYKVEGDRLIVWLMSRDAAEATIQKGQVKGTIEEEEKKEGFIRGKVKVTTLTDVEELSKFLANGGDKVLFPEKDKMIFSRVK